METVEPGSDYDTSEAESDADEAPAQRAVQQQRGSMDENHDTLNMPKTVCQGGRMKEADCNPADLALQPPASSEDAEGPPDQQNAAVESARNPANAVSGIEQTKPLKTAALGSAHKRRKRHGAPTQEGTYIGGGRRMMCYCPKHSHVARTPLPSAPAPALAPATAASLPAKAAAAPQTELYADQRSEQQHDIGQTSDKGPQALFSGQPVAYQLPQHKAGCVRGLPFNHACRRGQREPDAIAAAIAKRLFVAKTPYLIGAPRQHQQQQIPLSQTHLTEEPFLVASTSCEQGTMPSKCQSAAKTQTQRFKEMQETVGRRLTCGKSAIHGLGAFTKKPHMPGMNYPLHLLPVKQKVKLKISTCKLRAITECVNAECVTETLAMSVLCSVRSNGKGRHSIVALHAPSTPLQFPVASPVV